MSWSIGMVGKPAAVAKQAAVHLAAIKCAEPEESIKTAVAGIIATSLASFGERTAVTLTASGSQYTADGVGTNAVVQLKIEMLYGFIE